VNATTYRRQTDVALDKGHRIFPIPAIVRIL
jgi:hypothetical protein